MLLKDEKKQLIKAHWQEITEARQRCSNIWQEDWHQPFHALVTAFSDAAAADTPEAWSNLSLRGRQLRELMSEADGEEAILYIKLIKLTDTVEVALDEVATPANIIPRGELGALIKRLDRQSELIAEERALTSIWRQDQRQRLEEIEERIKTGKRTILHVGELSLVSFGIDELISAIKDGIIAIKNGVELASDVNFTDNLRSGARKL